MKRRILSVILAIMMVMTFLPSVTAWLEDYQWRVIDSFTPELFELSFSPETGTFIIDNPAAYDAGFRCFVVVDSTATYEVSAEFKFENFQPSRADDRYWPILGVLDENYQPLGSVEEQNYPDNEWTTLSCIFYADGNDYVNVQFYLVGTGKVTFRDVKFVRLSDGTNYDITDDITFNPLHVNVMNLDASYDPEPEPIQKLNPIPEPKPLAGTHKINDPLGDIVYSDLTAYINGEAIPTSIKQGVTMVEVEDLARYGFDVKWDGEARTLNVERNKNKAFNPKPVVKDTANKPGTFKTKYVYTDIKTYLSGALVESFAVDGVTLIDLELLAKRYNGKTSWDGKTKELKIVFD